MAEARQTGFFKRLKADPELDTKYCKKMTEVMSNKYCCLVPGRTSERQGKTRYAPYHCTSALNKFTIVFDYNAKYKKFSLKNALLQGRDMTTNPVGFLLCFRQKDIAVVPNIKSMFFQVLVNKKDCNMFRFLWFPNNNMSGSFIECAFIFSSPRVAAFALRQTAKENLTGANDKTV